MAKVVVTGGTGTLGAALVSCLAGRGHDVTALARRPPSGASGPRSSLTYARGDVVSGEGIDAAVEGADAIVHAVSPPMRRMFEAEVAGTVGVLGAARRSGAHFVYVSIVGIDRIDFPYYRAKLAAERVVEALGDRWTIQRATQFHDLIDRFLGLPVAPFTRHLAFQPVDAGDLSERLAALVEAGPSGRAADVGGPEVLGVRELAEARDRITGRGSRLVLVPGVGFLGDLDRGGNLCPDQRTGKTTWEEWLEGRSRRLSG